MTEETTYCDGSDEDVKTNLACMVPMAALAGAPYSLPRGALIVAQAQAYNLKGWGALSPANTLTSGAVQEAEPIAPGAPSRVEATTDDF
jgi:hypothetical protein